jgi:hypothetical protein
MSRLRSTQPRTARTRLARTLAATALLLAALFSVSAASAMAQGPNAIGQSSDGTSYVGFADSPIIKRIDANGSALSSFTSQVSPVVAISVDPSDHVWILSPSSVAEYSSTGQFLSSFDLHTCTGNGNTPKDPNRYGGFVVTSSYVYIGLNCSPVLERFNRDGSGFVATTIPDIPRGVAFGPAQSGKPNEVYVALPDANRVLTFNADTFGSGVSASHTLIPATPSGGHTPMPTGIGIDTFGQLMVEDGANNFVYFYDTNNNDKVYRTLGHGPAPGSDAGSLNFPAALALHAQDGTGLANNLFLADYRNARVQRWDSGGYTFWASDANSPGGSPPAPELPANSTAPSISGTAVTGQTVTCSPGTWTGSPTFTYAWKRDGATIAGGQTYVITSADVGHALTCTVTASNSAGQASATSAATTPTAPSGQVCTGTVGVSINSAAQFTNTPKVTLTIRPPSGATQVLISNDGGFETPTVKPVAGDCHYAFVLPTSGSERLPKTVYVRFVGSGFDNTLTLSDDIILDETAPTTSSATASRVTTSSRSAVVATDAKKKTKKKRIYYLLRVKAKDKNSGVKRLQLSKTRSSKHARTVTYHSSVKLTTLSTARWIRVLDRAGNASKWRAVHVKKHR